MPPWAWRSTRESCRSGRGFQIAASLSSKNAHERALRVWSGDFEISNCGIEGSSTRRRNYLPAPANKIASKIGVCPRKRHCGFHCSAMLLAQSHHAAIHLPLRLLIGEQQCLPFAHRYTQKQKCAVGVHIQSVRFFVECIYSPVRRARRHTRKYPWPSGGFCAGREPAQHPQSVNWGAACSSAPPGRASTLRIFGSFLFFAASWQMGAANKIL